MKDKIVNIRQLIPFLCVFLIFSGFMELIK